MTNIIKLSLLALLALAFLTACQEDNKITGPRYNEPVRDEAAAGLDIQSANLGEIPSIPGWEENDLEPGHIFLSNDSQNLYVSYYLSDAWQLAGVDLNISKTSSEIPNSGQGLPLPEKFRYKASLSQCETAYTQVIPLTELGLGVGDDFVLVSRALVGEKDPGGQISDNLNICVPGIGDQQWWKIGRGRVKSDPNAPDRLQKLTLTEVKDAEQMF